MQRAEKLHFLIKDDKWPKLPRGQDFFVTGSETGIQICLLKAPVKKLFTTTCPEQVCTREFLLSCRWVRKVISDELTIPPIPAGSEDLSSNSPDEC
jgi:hypothetical protein